MAAEIRGRRRIAAAVGLVALFVASAATASACIFDQSNYQGGGRVDRGGELTIDDAAAEADTSPQPGPTEADDGGDGSPPDPLLDAGDG
jgi:hypothetical protein